MIRCLGEVGNGGNPEPGNGPLGPEAGNRSRVIVTSLTADLSMWNLGLFVLIGVVAWSRDVEGTVAIGGL